MTASRNRSSLGLALAVAILALPVGVGSASAAEQSSAQDIIEALKVPRMTRGLTTSPAGTARAASESAKLSAKPTSGRRKENRHAPAANRATDLRGSGI